MLQFRNIPKPNCVQIFASTSQFSSGFAKIKLMKQSVRSKKRVKKSQPNQMIEEDPEVPQAEVHGEYFLLCFFIAYREF